MLMIISKRFLAVLLVGITFLSLGVVVKKKDSIQNTQTDPIAYQEKVRQEAEGKKGPPVPTLELFPKENFLGEGPVEEFKVGSENLGQPAENYPAWFEEEEPEDTSAAQEEEPGYGEEEIKDEGEEADIYSSIP